MPTHSTRRVPVISAALIAGLTAATAAAAAGLTLSPAANHPKGTVTVSGAGFGAGELVDIYFDTIDVATPLTAATKKFAGVGITLSASVAPGTHWITAVGRKSGLVAQRPFQVRTDWVERRFGRTGRGYNPYENLLNPYTVGQLGEAWKVKTANVIFGAPAVYGGLVYFGTFNGTVRAVSAVSGAQKWIQGGLGSVVSTPALVGGLAVVASGDGKVRAFVATTGVKKWGPVTIDSTELAASPVILGSKVYVVSANGTLARVESTTGHIDWTTSLPSAAGLSGSPSLSADGTLVLVPSDDGTLYALDAATGAPKWFYTTGAAIVSQPATVAGRIVFASTDHKVYCLDETGALLWSVDTTFVVQSSPAVSGTAVFIGNGSGKQLKAYDLATGTTLWTATTGNTVDSSPIYVAGVVYVGSNDRQIRAYDAATGTQLWSGLTGASLSAASPVVSDGRLFIGGTDNTLHAYAIDAGADRAMWSTAAPDPASLHPRAAGR